MNLFRTRSVPLAALALSVFALDASAAVIDFDDMATPYYAQEYSGFSSGGFDFSASIGYPGEYFVVWGVDNGYNADPGAATVAADYPNAVVTMAASDGAAFNLVSIDFADIYNSGTASGLLFTFNHAAGGSSTRTLFTDATRGLQTFVFDQVGLSSVSWVSTSGTVLSAQFDNVTTTAAVPVPEPTSAALLAAGLVAVAGGARLRRNR